MIRFKDCRFEKSTLSSDESIRFRTAFYRLWLYSRLPSKFEEAEDDIHSEGFLTDNEDEEDEEGDNELDQDVPEVIDAPAEEGVVQTATDMSEKPIRLTCDQALTGLNPSEVLDIYLVNEFLCIFKNDVRKRNEGRDRLYGQHLSYSPTVCKGAIKTK